jgi:acyl-CoA dehydrogenase
MPPASPYYNADHETFRAQVRRFVEREIAPHVNAWDEAGEVPRELYTKAAQAGVLGLGYPEEYGGVPVPDGFYRIVMMEELARAGSGGVVAALGSLGIGLPPILAVGTPEQKQRLAPPVLSGEKICALAITEPSGGSDVANLKTRATRDGEHYVVNGSKTFITSGLRADVITTAVRTGETGLGGVSLLVVEGDAPGLSRTPLRKMGWWASDTATLYFQDCRVPVANRLGPENAGFIAIMKNFNSERLGLAAQAWAFGKVCLDESIAYARERVTFGRPLIKSQVIRHKLVDMAMRLNGVKAYLDELTWRCDKGEMPIAELCMLKNLATTTLEFVASEAMQVFGGAGYLRDCKVERIYRETKVLTIGGGSLEIMKDLAARQMGL